MAVTPLAKDIDFYPLNKAQVAPPLLAFFPKFDTGLSQNQYAGAEICFPGIGNEFVLDEKLDDGGLYRLSIKRASTAVVIV